MQLYILYWGETASCETIFYYAVLPRHMGSHTPSSEDSISGECMLLCKDIVVVTEDSPHITIRLIENVHVALVYLLVSVCCRHGPSQDRYIENVHVTLVYLLASVCWRHGPSQDRYMQSSVRQICVVADDQEAIAVRTTTTKPI